jgi:hypothetical protein
MSAGCTAECFQAQKQRNRNIPNPSPFLHINLNKPYWANQSEAFYEPIISYLCLPGVSAQVCPSAALKVKTPSTPVSRPQPNPPSLFFSTASRCNHPGGQPTSTDASSNQASSHLDRLSTRLFGSIHGDLVRWLSGEYTNRSRNWTNIFTTLRNPP